MPSQLEALDRRDQLLAVPRRLFELVCDLAPDHDQQPVADAEILEVVGDQEHRHAFVASLADGIEQRLLRCDVDSDGRVHDDQNRRIRRQRPADHDLLLIAAAEAGYGLLEAPRHDLQPVGLHPCDAVALPGIDDPENAARYVLEHRKRQILAHAKLRREAPRVPVLRDVTDSAVEHGVHLAGWYLAAEHSHRS